MFRQEALPPAAEPCVPRDRLCQEVFLIKLTPGLDPEVFDMLLKMHYRGVVVEAFGAGGLHSVSYTHLDVYKRQPPGGGHRV